MIYLLEMNGRNLVGESDRFNSIMAINIKSIINEWGVPLAGTV